MSKFCGLIKRKDNQKNMAYGNFMKGFQITEMQQWISAVEISVEARTRVLYENEEWSTPVTKWIILKGDDKKKGIRLFEEWRGNRIIAFLSGSLIVIRYRSKYRGKVQ